MFLFKSLFDFEIKEFLKLCKEVVIKVIFFLNGKDCFKGLCVLLLLDMLFGLFIWLEMMCCRYLFDMFKLLISMMNCMILFFGGKLFCIIGFGYDLFCILCWIMLIKLEDIIWLRVGIIDLIIFFCDVDIVF